MHNIIQNSKTTELKPIDEQQQQDLPSDFFKMLNSMNLNLSDVSNKNKEFESSFLHNLIHQQQQQQLDNSALANQSIDSQTSSSEANNSSFTYDPFNDYTGIDKMINQQQQQYTNGVIGSGGVGGNKFQTKVVDDGGASRTFENFFQTYGDGNCFEADKQTNSKYSQSMNNSNNQRMGSNTFTPIEQNGLKYFQNNRQQSNVDSFDQFRVAQKQQQLDHSPTFASLRGNSQNKYTPRMSSASSVNGTFSLAPPNISDCSIDDYSNQYDDDVFSNGPSSQMNNSFQFNNNDKLPTSPNSIDPLTYALIYKKFMQQQNQQSPVNDNRALFSNFKNSSPTISDLKSRHHSLMAFNKMQQANSNNMFNNNSISNGNSKPMSQNYTSFPNNNNNNNTNNFNDLNNAKKRAHSFGLNNFGSFMPTSSNNSSPYGNNSLLTTPNEYSLQNNNQSFSSSSSSQITSPNANSKPLRSERLPSQFIDDLVKQAKMRRKNGGKKEVCVFCKNNGEKELIYTSHTLKDSNNHVSCPILRLYQCPICHATAENAHTIKYCPFAEKDETIKLFKDSRMNTAVLLMNSYANNANTNQSSPPSSSPPSPPQMLSKQQSMPSLNANHLSSMVRSMGLF